MGLDIFALKVKRKVSKNEFDPSNCNSIYTLDFSPIKHLSVIDEGLYETEIVGDGASISYGSYSRFRESLCRIFYGEDFINVVNNVDEFLERPFIEMIYFADNEGSFDYKIAEKLYNDFRKYKDKAWAGMSPAYYLFYLRYMDVLKNVIDVKGVVHYT